MKIVVGSRDSKLAVVQAELVMKQIKAHCPNAELELVTMKTTGDLILDRTLDQIGGKGLFVKELDRALTERRVDLTVHSLKDLPMEESEALPLLAVPKREDPRDVLILPQGSTALDPKLPIGCSSLRRQVQLKELYPQMQVAPIRGNVQTRLKKLDEGQYSALVLAYAGILRLGLERRVSRVFSVEEILPAAGQGILAIQGRADFDRRVLEGVSDGSTWTIAQAERSFVRALEGGCSAPTAAYATIDGGELSLTGFYVTAAGTPLKQSLRGSLEQAAELGVRLAEQFKTIREEQDGR